MGATTLTAYGVTFALDERIRLLGVATGGSTGARRCHVRLASLEEVESAWAGASAERLRELRLADGRLVLAVDFDPVRGYRFDAPHHGQSLVSADGARITCVPGEKDESWQHVLLSQLAPLAATLQGVEVFHAGAVAVGGEAALFCAASGTGKSTLIARLAMRGAALVADDAVAIERSDGGVVAHPGTELVHLTATEADALAAAPGLPLTPVEGYRMAKIALVAPSPASPVTVREIFLMERTPGRAGTVIEEAAPDARALLAATLMPMVSDSVRLRRHFELCAHLAETLPLYRVAVAEAEPRDRLAGAVWERLAAT